VVREQAPGVVLQMLDVPSREIVARLADGTVDMAVDAEFEIPDWICQRTLHRSFIVTAARRWDPTLTAAGVSHGQRIPPELYCAIPHVLMSMDGSRTGTIDRALAEKGLARQVAMTVPHFQAVALAVAEAGLLGSLPVYYARRVAPLLGLDLFLPPIDPPLLDARLFWHRRQEGNVAQAWLRERVAQVLDLGRPEAVSLGPP
jgi:DNA-binding transcriptional LysR family regulator